MTETATILINDFGLKGKIDRVDKLSKANHAPYIFGTYRKRKH